MQAEAYRGRGRRERLRLVYPPEYRPVLIVNGRELEVGEISEAGLCVLNPDKDLFSAEVHGDLNFIDGDTLSIAGRVVWDKNGWVGLHLTGKLIPYELFFKEQQNMAWLDHWSL